MSYGYRSWQTQDKNFDDSYDDPYTASPPTYTSDPYGFDLATDEPSPPTKSSSKGKGSTTSSRGKSSGGNKKKGSDIYDYDFSNDEITTPPKSSKFGNKSKPVRRMSTDDRINEILEKSKIKNPITSGPDTDDGNEEDDTYNSWKNSWNQLIEGVGASPGSLLESQENSSPEKDPKPQIGKKKPNLDASDSFEISEGDFEVGTFAARRSQEKGNERRARRAAMDTAPTMTASPDVSNKHQKGLGRNDPIGLSSIHASGDNNDDSLARYGSIGGKSDGDLLKILSETRPTFRYPLTSDGDSQSNSISNPNSLSFSKDEPDGTPTHSKRRLQQMERKRSLSPKPLHGGSATVTSMISPVTKSQSITEHKGANPESSDTENHSDEEGKEHDGDYSLDDFDPVSPHAQQSSLSVPSVKSAIPPPTTTSSKPEDPTQKSLDEIRQRWMNPSSFFSSAPKEDEAPKVVPQNAPIVAPNISNPALDRSPSPTSDDTHEATTPIQLNQQENSFFSPENNPPPPPPDDEETDVVPSGHHATNVVEVPMVKKTIDTETKVPRAANQRVSFSSYLEPEILGKEEIDHSSPVHESIDVPPPPPLEPQKSAQNPVPLSFQIPQSVNHSHPEFAPPYVYQQHIHNYPPQFPYAQDQQTYQNPPSSYRYGYGQYPFQHEESKSLHFQSVPDREDVEIVIPTYPNSKKQGPQGKEIDPEKFLLSRSALFNSSERIIPNNSAGREPNRWPASMIPMVPPSTTELHGKIAALRGRSEPSKEQIASGVALLKSKNLKQKRSRSGIVNRSGEHIIGRTVLSASQASTVSSSLANLPVLSDPQFENVTQINALSRIEVSNSKLLRQFEELDREIKSMRLNQQQVSKPRPNKSRSRSRSAEKVAHSSELSSRSENNRPILDQDTEAVNAIRQLFQESIEKDAYLREKEKTLRIRESFLEQTKSNHLTQTRMLENDNQVQRAEWTSEKIELNRRLNEACEINASQRNEINALKSQLYNMQLQLQQPIPQIPHESINKSRKELVNKARIKEKMIFRANKVGLSHQNMDEVKVDNENVDDEYPPDHDITISAKEHNDLLKEVEELKEILILYEKENERMVKIIVEKENEMKDLTSQFYDKRESLVQEINRLSSQHHANSLPQGQFQSTLERDSHIYNLQEYIYDLESQVRQRDDLISDHETKINSLENEKIVLLKNIESFKKHIQQQENQLEELDASRHGAEDSKKLQELEEQFEHERSKYTLQIQELHARLKWYSSTQERLDLITKERDELKVKLHELKNLRNESFSRADSQSISTSTGLRRNPHDAKRIKELETALHAAQESIKKRFPDSVANLLYSNILQSDENIDEVVQRLEKEKTLLQIELDKSREESELKLTGLRQDFEKMRTQYESQIESLTEELRQYRKKSNQRSTSPDAFLTKGISTVPLEEIKSFGQAKEKIQFLEVENARLRQFYTKKVEGLQKKYQAQLHAIKRGAGLPTNIKAYDAPETMEDANSGLVVQLTEENQQLNEKITILEEELLQTAEELGRLKAISSLDPPSSLPPQASQAPHSQSPPQSSPLNEELFKRIHQLENEIQNIRSNPPSSSSPPVQEVIPPSQLREYKVREENYIREISQLRQDLAESIRLQEKSSHQLLENKHEIQRDEAIIHELEAEVLDLKEKLRKPQTPKMQHFMLMEHKLTELEERFNRRETELLKLLEQSKVSANMERMRLQSLHEQELRDKDEQLLQFQRELEELIQAMTGKGRPTN